MSRACVTDGGVPRRASSPGRPMGAALVRSLGAVVVASAWTLLVLPSFAHANDGAFHGEGATVFAYKEHRVRMVSENIRIRYDPSRDHPEAEWDADCTFEFENLTDEPLTLQMGFPERRAFPSRVRSIQGFRTLVRGKPVPSIYKTVEPEPGPTLLDPLRAPAAGSGGLGVGSGRASGQAPQAKAEPPDPWVAMAKGAKERMNLWFDAAYTWPVSFAPRERVVVKNRYRFGGAGTNGPIGLCLQHHRPPGGPFWHASPPRTGLGGGPCSEVTYVVTSGKTWVAPIGEAIIEIDIPPGVAPNHVIPLPAATELTANTVRWHFKNFVPREELRVLFATSMHQEDDAPAGLSVDFSTADQVREWLDYAKVNGARPEFIRRMRDIQAYSFGVRAAGAPKPKVFEVWSLPQVEGARAPGALSPAQRKILDLLGAGLR